MLLLVKCYDNEMVKSPGCSFIGKKINDFGSMFLSSPIFDSKCFSLYQLFSHQPFKGKSKLKLESKILRMVHEL